MTGENVENKKETTEVTVNNPHDATFKSTFKEVRIAKDVIENNLPEEMIRDMDLDTLQLLDGSFVSKELGESFTDVLYGVEVAGNDIYIALLLEHKSTPDKFAAFQVSRYIIDLWEMVLKEKQELPVVIPIIFYHGIKSWSHATDVRKYIPNYEALPDYLKVRLPTIKHDFITMRTHDEERMQEYQPLTRIILRSFKYVFYDIDTLLDQFLTSIDELEENVIDDDVQRIVELMLFYFTQSNQEFTEKNLMRKLRELDGKGEEIVSILQERENKGILKGREEGRLEGKAEGKEQGLVEGREQAREDNALNMLKDGLSVERIAKYTDLPVEKVEELQKKM